VVSAHLRRPASPIDPLLLLCGYLAFTTVHVALVLATGAHRNFNHIVLGTDNTQPLGFYLGCVGLAGVVASWVLAYFVAWKFPRAIQRLHKLLITPLELGLSRLAVRSP
jgi:hypothetical protein